MRHPPVDGQPKEVHTCVTCGKAYSRLEYLRRHMRKHNDVKPFECHLCPKKFARSDVLLRHKKRCHPDDISSPPVAGGGSTGGPTSSSTTAPRGAKRSAPTPSSSSLNLGGGGGAGGGGANKRGRVGPTASRSRTTTNPNNGMDEDDEDEDEEDGDGDDDISPSNTTNIVGTGISGSNTDYVGPGGMIFPDVDDLDASDASGSDDRDMEFALSNERGGGGVGGGGGGYGSGSGINALQGLSSGLNVGAGSGYPITNPLDFGGYASLPGFSQYPGYGNNNNGNGTGYGNATTGFSLNDIAVRNGTSADGYRLPSNNLDSQGYPQQQQTYSVSPVDQDNYFGGQQSQQQQQQGSRVPGGVSGNGDGSNGDGGYNPYGGSGSILQGRYGNINGLGNNTPNAGVNQQQPLHNRGNSISMEDATTLLSIAFGGNAFPSTSGNGTSMSVSPSNAHLHPNLVPPPRNASASGSDGTPSSGPHQHIIANAGSVAGHTVVPDWNPQPRQTGLMGGGNNSNGGTGGSGDSNPTGMGLGGINRSGSLGANDPVRAHTTQNPFAGSLGPGQGMINWAAPGLPGMITPGGTDYGRLGIDPQSWLQDVAFSPLPVLSMPSPGFNSLFNTTPMTLDEDDPILAAEADIWQQLVHLPGSVPQLSNHNPERPLLRIASNEMKSRSGPELDVSDRYYFPPSRVAGCYTIPHWGMPSMATLRRVARQTVTGTLIHLPMVHLPTFRLKDVPVPVMFSIITVGTPKNSPMARSCDDDNYDAVTAANYGSFEMRDRSEWFTGAGVIRPTIDLDEDVGGKGAPIEVCGCQTEEEKDWDTRKKLVTNEKVQMITHLLAGVKYHQYVDEHKVALAQGLLIMAAPQLLSSVLGQREIGYNKIGNITKLTHQLGLFSPAEPHYKTYSSPSSGDNYFAVSHNVLEHRWKDWIKLEGMRRFVWMLYLFDTLAIIETGAPQGITAIEIACVPLPAPDNLWNAQSAEEWNQNLLAYKPATLDEAMSRLFNVEDWNPLGGPGHDASKDPPNMMCILNATDFGMFARLAMILTILRGIVMLGQGRLEGGEWSSITGLWRKEDQSEGGPPGNPATPLTLAETVNLYATALHRWRQGWDFDPHCENPAAAAQNLQSALNKTEEKMNKKMAEKERLKRQQAEQEGRTFDESTPDLMMDFGVGSNTSATTAPRASGPSLVPDFNLWWSEKEKGVKAGGSGNSTGPESSSSPMTPGEIRDNMADFAKPKGGVLLYEEALPFYWLCQALHSLLAQDNSVAATCRARGGTREGSKASAKVDRLKGVNMERMLRSARVFTRLGEGIQQQ